MGGHSSAHQKACLRPSVWRFFCRVRLQLNRAGGGFVYHERAGGHSCPGPATVLRARPDRTGGQALTWRRIARPRRCFSPRRPSSALGWRRTTRRSRNCWSGSTRKDQDSPATPGPNPSIKRSASAGSTRCAARSARRATRFGSRRAGRVAPGVRSISSGRRNSRSRA